MARSKASRIGETFRNQRLIDQALERAAQKAILQHKRAGLPLIIWRDGKAIFVSAEELERGDGRGKRAAKVPGRRSRS
jgi:hypothetical protein